MKPLLPVGKCRNPRCRDVLYTHTNLCPSCRWVGKRAFALGAFLAGVAVAIAKAKGWL